MRTVLFICSGNTCRSPMAEAIARRWIRDQQLTSELFAASAGTFAADGGPISSETIRALDSIGIEHTGTSKALSQEMIRKAALILCMSEEHVRAAQELVDDPEDQAKIERLDPEHDIDDPVGRGQKAYDKLVQKFKTLIPTRLKEWRARENRTRIGSSRR